MPADLTRPLSDDELAAYDDLLQLAGERADLGLSVESLDGFTAALIVTPHTPAAEDWLPVLLGPRSLAVFDSDAERTLFETCFARRRREIERALAAPVENLADPKAYSPLILDWQAILNDMRPDEAAALKAHGVPLYGEIWAAGFVQVVEHWEDRWALPADSKDEAYVDGCLDPFYTLITPRAEWTPDEKKLSRESHVANAIWAVYDLREFWLDRGTAPREPVRKAAEPGRNDPCSCGSGKKFKKCCGLDQS